MHLVRPGLPIVETSARSGEGMERWLELLTAPTTAGTPLPLRTADGSRPP